MEKGYFRLWHLNFRPFLKNIKIGGTFSQNEWNFFEKNDKNFSKISFQANKRQNRQNVGHYSVINGRQNSPLTDFSVRFK